MRCQGIGRRTVVLWAVIAAMLLLPSFAFAQIGGGGGNGGGGGAAGVFVDAKGVVHRRIYQDPGGRLFRQRIAAAKAALTADVADYSKLRWISINRLEDVIRQREGVPTNEMRYLAGLLRVQYVFFYPESGDIVIGGPAEGWVSDLSGRVVGLTSGRPTLQLQDLIVALRAFPANGNGQGLIGCSIDPTEEGLAAVNRFLGGLNPSPTNAFAQHVASGIRTSVGLQNVSVMGVSPETHFAQVMVEADYRMKLIGIGLERPPIRLLSYVDRASPADVAADAMQRWYFVPDYECVRATDDGLAMEMVGNGVKLIGADEVVGADGQRHQASRANQASKAFVTSFTKNYPLLADRSPVFAELRNLIDLAVVAAHIQQEDYYAKADWKMELFGDEEAFAVETYSIPETVETAVNVLWRRGGRQLMTPFGGGVEIRATRALDSDNLMADDQGKVAKAREAVQLELAEGQWWWD